MSSPLFFSLRKGAKDYSMTHANTPKIIGISSIILIKDNSGEKLIKKMLGNIELSLLTM